MAPIPHGLSSYLHAFSQALSSRSASSSSHLTRRATQMISIPSTYRDLNSRPGIVVAIVLATVCGFVLLIWLLALVFSPGGPFPLGDSGTVISSSESSRSRSIYTRPRRRRPEVVEVINGSPSVSARSGLTSVTRDLDEEEDYEDEYEQPQSPPRSHRQGYKPVRRGRR